MHVLYCNHICQISLSLSCREQEEMIKALRGDKLELEAENEALRDVNAHSEDHPDLNASGSSSSSLQRNASITRLVVDLDLTNLPSSLEAGPSNGGVATATATVPIKFESMYRSVMEKGL